MKKFLNCWIVAALLSGANSAVAGVFTEAGFQQLYLLDIPNNANYNTGAAPAYSLDNSASIATGSFDRVAYYLELQIGTAPLNWVWVSFDTPSPNASHLGVPGILGSAQTFDLLVSNMNVFSNTAVTTGTGIATGNIEFWSNNYDVTADGPAPGGSSGVFDFDDIITSPSNGYGSMQIHNFGVGETLLAYNQWGVPSANSGEMGIGNRPALHTDWTFSGNALTYDVKNLEVWVGSVPTFVPEPASLALFGLGLAGLGFVRRRRSAA